MLHSVGYATGRRDPADRPPDVVRRDGGALPRPDARPLPAHRLRHRRVGPGVHDARRSSSAATASARSATSTRSCTTARASRTRSATRSASTKRTTPCCGSTSTTTPAPRCAGCAGWTCPSTSPSPTTSTWSTGGFYQDGNIECEVRATGIMVTTPLRRRARPIQRHGGRRAHLCALPPTLPGRPAGPRRRRHRQHGLHDVESYAEPIGPDNPHGLSVVTAQRPAAHGAARACRTRLRHPAGVEGGEPQRRQRHRHPPVPTSWCPAARSRRCSTPTRRCSTRANVIGHTLWVTPTTRRALALRRVRQPESSTDTGLPAWTAANRPIENTDVVLWYVFGIHHITRVEDWPVMPVDTVSFWLKPFGFFDRNPALDVAPTPHCHS